MKTASLIRALEKEGFKVEKCERNRTRYFTSGPLNKLDWFDQYGDVVCANVMRKNAIEDFQSDYNPGWFCDTIKEIIKDLKQEKPNG